MATGAEGMEPLPLAMLPLERPEPVRPNRSTPPNPLCHISQRFAGCCGPRPPLRKASLCLRQGPGEVLLRVDVAGLCHSDLHILDGMIPMLAASAAKRGTTMDPLALSHEIGGTIMAVGDGVDASLVGKERVLYPWLGCGDCIQCADPNSDEIFCAPRARAARRLLLPRA